ncbi:hypothetical protein VP01_1637g4 [Puccinia sorghi]|uniref:DUF659 domain-containing protein n=1 Tax=Puccinia sorghi TaxID=27349 RepID=A0A0L6VHD2_9BASI|nr:hypothetical protein VP01_1637g4 [Puccinia sorghi]
MQQDPTCHCSIRFQTSSCVPNSPSTSQLPDSLNPWPAGYRDQLARSPYKLPRQVQMIAKILPHAWNELEMLEKLRGQNQLTLSLDGWTNNSGNSIYALMALMTHLRWVGRMTHTSDNIFLATKGLLNSKQVKWHQLSTVVTDLPSTMIKLCEFLHIQKVHITLHVYNFIAKQHVGHAMMEDTAKGNKPLSKTASSRVSKLFVRHTVIDTPSLTEGVIKLIDDQDHFTANQVLISLLKPVFNTITKLKQSVTTLANISKELINTYKNISEVDISSIFETFKQNCLDIAVSKKTFTFRYRSNDSSSFQRLKYGKIRGCSYSRSEPLKKLAIGVLQCVPGVEGLFSMMNTMKNKARSQLSTTTLKMMVHIKLHLLQGDPLLAPCKSQKRTRDDSEYESMKAYNIFFTPTDLEAFKKGVFT